MSSRRRFYFTQGEAEQRSAVRTTPCGRPPPALCLSPGQCQESARRHRRGSPGLRPPAAPPHRLRLRLYRTLTVGIAVTQAGGRNHAEGGQKHCASGGRWEAGAPAWDNVTQATGFHQEVPLRHSLPPQSVTVRCSHRVTDPRSLAGLPALSLTLPQLLGAPTAVAQARKDGS